MLKKYLPYIALLALLAYGLIKGNEVISTYKQTINKQEKTIKEQEKKYFELVESNKSKKTQNNIKKITIIDKQGNTRIEETDLSSNETIESNKKEVISLDKLKEVNESSLKQITESSAHKNPSKIYISAGINTKLVPYIQFQATKGVFILGIQTDKNFDNKSINIGIGF